MIVKIDVRSFWYMIWGANVQYTIMTESIWSLNWKYMIILRKLHGLSTERIRSAKVMGPYILKLCGHFVENMWPLIFYSLIIVMFQFFVWKIKIPENRLHLGCDNLGCTQCAIPKLSKKVLHIGDIVAHLGLQCNRCT